MTTFLISDTHFSHANILNFEDGCGRPIRPFKSVEEMDEALIENWNSVVKEGDKVYHLGDVCIQKSGLSCLSRCNGKKVLIRGNHDIYKLKDYAAYFKDIRGAFVLDKFIMTHIPIHPESIERFKGNIHGHLHSNTLSDKRYFNVSVENINFTPIAFDEIKSNFRE